MFENISLLGVLVAAVAGMAVGFLWYGPLFGKAWMEASGLSKEKLDEMKKKGANTSYALSFLAGLVMAWVLAMFMNFTGADTLMEGAMTGFWVWLGFVATTHLAHTLFQGTGMKLYYVTVGHHLAELLVIGAVLTLF